MPCHLSNPLPNLLSKRVRPDLRPRARARRTRRPRPRIRIYGVASSRDAMSHKERFTRENLQPRNLALIKTYYPSPRREQILACCPPPPRRRQAQLPRRPLPSLLPQGALQDRQGPVPTLRGRAPRVDLARPAGYCAVVVARQGFHLGGSPWRRRASLFRRRSFLTLAFVRFTDRSTNSPRLCPRGGPGRVGSAL